MRHCRPAALALLLLAAAAPAAAQSAHPPCTGPIAVIDGDTVEACGMRWRLDGIDAPEISHARCADEGHRAIKAAARLMDLIAERGAQIVPVINRLDRIASGGFGRKLGRLVFGDGSTWVDVAIVEGHAVAYQYGKQPLPNWCGAPA